MVDILLLIGMGILGMEAQNPQAHISAWCYGGEDFVGRISDIGMAERHGFQPAKRSHLLSHVPSSKWTVKHGTERVDRKFLD